MVLTPTVMFVMRLMVMSRFRAFVKKNAKLVSTVISMMIAWLVSITALRASTALSVFHALILTHSTPPKPSAPVVVLDFMP